jgi:hypothetical protein
MSIKIYDFKQEFRGTGENTTAHDLVLLGPVGLTFANATWHYVKHIMPKKDYGNDQTGTKESHIVERWKLIEPAYTAWKNGQELPVDGTAISSWPGLPKAVGDAFIRSGIKTIEEIASMNETTLSRVAVPNIRAYIKQAQDYFVNRDKGINASKAAETEKKIQDLQDQLAAAMELLEAKVTKDGGKAKAA